MVTLRLRRGVLSALVLVVLAGGCARERDRDTAVVASAPVAQSQPVTQPAAQAAPAADAADREVAQKGDAKPTTFFLNLADVDVAAVLPRPFAPGSAMARAEGDLLLGIRAEADAQAKERMARDEHMTLFTFADVLGPGFTKEKYPQTAALFKKVDSDAYAVIAPAKAMYERARPPYQDARVKGLLEHSKSASYPSGHATTGMVWSRVLSELAPEKSEELRARARLMALDRVVAGVHYPTDVIAGMALGDAIADGLLKSSEFRAELERVRAVEWK